MNKIDKPTIFNAVIIYLVLFIFLRGLQNSLFLLEISKMTKHSNNSGFYEVGKTLVLNHKILFYDFLFLGISFIIPTLYVSLKVKKYIVYNSFIIGLINTIIMLCFYLILNYEAITEYPILHCTEIALGLGISLIIGVFVNTRKGGNREGDHGDHGGRP